MNRPATFSKQKEHPEPRGADRTRAGSYEGRFYTVTGGAFGGSARSDAERDVVVVDSVEVAEGVVALTLEGADGTLPLWTAGAHLDLVLPDGRSSQYSLSGNPSLRGGYRLGVLRSEGEESVSRGVHELRPGDRVTIRGPRNQFALVPAPSYVFIAGGIGITPIMSMIQSAIATGIPWHMYYVGRSRARMAFLDEVEAWGDNVTIWADDERGRRIDIASVLTSAADDALIYCCGPQPMLDAVESEGELITPGRVRTERFTSRPLTHLTDETFEVRCELSDTTLVIPPGTSILAEAKRNGIPTVSSCNKGICGTCETVVLDGTPDHRDSVLDDEDKAEGDTMMICVSRAIGPRLVLDL